MVGQTGRLSVGGRRHTSAFNFLLARGLLGIITLLTQTPWSRVQPYKIDFLVWGFWKFCIGIRVRETDNLKCFLTLYIGPRRLGIIVVSTQLHGCACIHPMIVFMKIPIGGFLWKILCKESMYHTRPVKRQGQAWGVPWISPKSCIVCQVIVYLVHWSCMMNACRTNVTCMGGPSLAPERAMVINRRPWNVLKHHERRASQIFTIYAMGGTH
jgi:hypothetical protein